MYIQDGPKKPDHFWKCMTPLYDDVGRRSICQNYIPSEASALRRPKCNNNAYMSFFTNHKASALSNHVAFNHGHVQLTHHTRHTPHGINHKQTLRPPWIRRNLCRNDRTDKTPFTHPGAIPTTFFIGFQHNPQKTQATTSTNETTI